MKKITKKVLACILPAAILMSTAVTSFAASYNMHDWAKEEVGAFVESGLMPETMPEDLTADITRAEFAGVAVSIYESKMGEILTPKIRAFTDCDDMDVLKAYAVGIVNGVGDNKFAPDKNITRQEICTMLLRTIDAMDLSIPVTLQFIRFDDQNDIAEWAANAVEVMYKIGVIKGMSDKAEVAVIAPLASTTRQQAIVMAERLYKNYISDDAEEATEEKTDVSEDKKDETAATEDTKADDTAADVKTDESAEASTDKTDAADTTDEAATDETAGEAAPEVKE